MGYWRLCFIHPGSSCWLSSSALDEGSKCQLQYWSKLRVFSRTEKEGPRTVNGETGVGTMGASQGVAV